MEKMAFIAVGVFMIAGLNMTFNTQGNLNESETRLAENQYEILVRNAAVAGLDHVKQRLADDFVPYANVTGTNDGIPYSVNAVISGAVATVHAVSTIQDAEGNPIEFNVKAKFKQRTELPSEAPSFMRYAILSDEDLVFRGGIYVEGDEENRLNANVHSNGNLRLNGNSALTRGFGTYRLTAMPSAAAIMDNFVPYYNPTTTSSCTQISSVDIPPVNVAAIAFAATPDSTTPGDVELTGTYEFGGTREEPYVWHIQGNLTAKAGNTTINGYALFLVEGDVDFRGNTSAGGAIQGDGEESSLAFYTGGGVRLRGGTEVWGQIYSNGGIQFDAGTPEIHGSVTTKGEVDFRGAVDIFYRKASPGLTQELQPNITMLDRIAYSEW